MSDSEEPSAQSDPSGSGAAWHPDPTGRHEHRYWDGDDWTDQVSDGGLVSTDPPVPSATPVTPGDATLVDQPAVPAQDATQAVPPVGAVPPTAGVPPTGGVPPAGGAPMYGDLPGQPPAGGGSKVLPIVLGTLALVVIVVVAILALGGGGDDGGGDDSGSEVASDDADEDEPPPTTEEEDEPDDTATDDTVEPDDPPETTQPPEDDPTGGPAANEFEAGECTADPLTGDIGAIELVDCSQEHTAEGIGQFALDGDAYPGDAEVQSQASDGCLGELFEDYVGVSYQQSIYLASYISPTAQTWAAGDRVVICVINGTVNDDPLVGSAQGTNQ